jgi:phospholipase/lecithinase/hemolysin
MGDDLTLEGRFDVITPHVVAITQTLIDAAAAAAAPNAGLNETLEGIRADIRAARADVNAFGHRLDAS